MFMKKYQINFKNRFIEETKKPKLGNVWGEYITKISHYNNFIFVEGYSDINYYSVCLPFNNASYINCGGKTNVVHIHNYLYNHPEYTQAKKDYHYIVDKDYNGLNHAKDLKEDHKITLTKYHSFENYAFEEENIKIIFKELDLDNKINQFFQNLTHYFNDISLYEILQYLSTNNIIETKLTKIDKDKILIDDDLNISLLDSFKEEAHLSFSNKRIKIDAKHFEDEYNKAREKINKPIEIRGHDLELFINELLKKYGKDVSLVDILTNKEIVSKLNIELLLK